MVSCDVDRWSAPASDRHAASRRRVVIAAVFLSTLFASGPFAPGLTGGVGVDTLQQAIVEVFWVVIAALALPVSRLDHWRWDRLIVVLVAFVFWAVLSSMWAGAASMVKGGVLAVNVVAAFLLAHTQRFEDVVDATVAALFAICVASLILVVVAPDVAIVDDWQHSGQWTGAFDNKQTLGINSAFLLYLAAMRTGASRRPLAVLYHLAVMAAAVVCIVGAGSRGGGVLAVLAVGLGLSSRVSRGIERLSAVIPLLTLVISAVMIAMLWVSGRDFLSFGEWDIDFTERTKIWKHAIDYLSGGTLWFGSGLNGFWTRKDVADAFLGGHEWFLDNYHNGFLAILGDCGLVGAGLFVVLTALVPMLTGGETDHDRRGEVTLILGFLVLFYVIDMTETYFLRSTNTFSILWVLFVFRLFGRPRSAAGAG
ncbi:MAG: O-antigen ligase family protein [Phyllobacteriaceae bacterium]|nr:O-antigen ligase family protein [Phyllobacteriaceae bacterium]